MKRKNKWSHEDCRRIINENKENTNYFNGKISFDGMYEMFRYQMRFGEAETAVIIAALIRAGAKFS